MATIGQILTTPEVGWKRYDDNPLIIVRTGTWNLDTSPYYYGGSVWFTTDINAKLEFKFKGTMIRILANTYFNKPSGIRISIDGVEDTFSDYDGSGVGKDLVLVYEKVGLDNGEHTVVILSPVDLPLDGSKNWDIEAVDIDDTGMLLHLDEVTTLAELDKVGKRIRCHYSASSGVVGTFSNLGKEIGSFIPDMGTSSPNGDFYFIKVDTGLLVADRIVQHSIRWDTLNAGKVIQGLPWMDVGIIRSLSGGVSYADSNGNPVLSAPSPFNGGWPQNNEWDKYIVNFPLEAVTGGVTLNDVFHANNTQTLCQDTPALGLKKMDGTAPATSGARIQRGFGSDVFLWHNLSNFTYSNLGFRPVLEYREV